MKMVVLVKEVPDTYGARALDLETGLTDRAASDPVADEIGERALEVALSYADDHAGTEVIVLTMGPANAEATVRKMLAMGADSAIHVVDDGLVGADLGLTAEVLAAAIRKAGFDLVIAGDSSTDGAGGVIPAMLAEHLGVPGASRLESLEISEDGIRGRRVTESGTHEVSATLPAVVSITERMHEARFPSFKGIMAAKRKPLLTTTLADLGLNAEAPAVARSIVVGVSERPARAAGIKIVDEGDAATRLADFLVANRLA